MEAAASEFLRLPLSFRYENLHDTSVYPNFKFGYLKSIEFIILRPSKAIKSHRIAQCFSAHTVLVLRFVFVSILQEFAVLSFICAQAPL